MIAASTKPSFWEIPTGILTAWANVSVAPLPNRNVVDFGLLVHSTAKHRAQGRQRFSADQGSATTRVYYSKAGARDKARAKVLRVVLGCARVVDVHHLRGAHEGKLRLCKVGLVS